MIPEKQGRQRSVLFAGKEIAVGDFGLATQLHRRYYSKTT